MLVATTQGADHPVETGTADIVSAHRFLKAAPFGCRIDPARPGKCALHKCHILRNGPGEQQAFALSVFGQIGEPQPPGVTCIRQGPIPAT